MNDHPSPVLAGQIEQVDTAQPVRIHHKAKVEFHAGKVLYQAHIHGLADLLGVVEPFMQRSDAGHELVERIRDDGILLGVVMRDIRLAVEQPAQGSDVVCLHRVE